MGDFNFQLGKVTGYSGLQPPKQVPEYAEGYYDYERLFQLLGQGDTIAYNVDDFMHRPGFLKHIGDVVVYYSDVFPRITVNGKQRDLELKVKANTRVGYVHAGDSYPIRITLDPVTSEIAYEFRIRYADANGLREEEKYALIFLFRAYDDWVYALSRLEHNVSVIQEYIFGAFHDAFVRYSNNPDTLDFLYQHAPLWVIAKLGTERAYDDMKLLLGESVDEVGTNEEIAVLNILKSFVTPPYVQDAFFHREVNQEIVEAYYKADLPKNANRILTRLIEDKMDGVTVFEKLYYKINDYGGDDRFTELMKLFYALWLNSDFPNREYNDHNPADIVVVDYKAQKFLGFYGTNMNFSFLKQQIVVKQVINDGTPFSALMPIEIPKGVLHLFQPINLVELDPAGELKVPDKIIPAFFLKAIDDKNYWSNVQLVTDLVIDTVTLFTGIGNLVKLRHLARLGQGVETIRVLLAGMEVTSSVLSIMLSIVDNCTGNGFCAKLRQFLIFLDLATLGVDGLTSKYFLRSAEEALDVMPPQLRKKYPEIEKTLEDAVGGASIKRGSRYNGQIITEGQMIRLERFLKERRIDFQIGPAEGTFTVDNYFKKSGEPVVLGEKSAAYFITDGKNMKLVLRENATIYELLHELMHYRHCEKLGKRNYRKLGRLPYYNGTIIRERYVFDKLIQYRKFLTRKELIHARIYMNDQIATKNRFGEGDKAMEFIGEFDFDIDKIPERIQKINFEKLLMLK